MSSPKRMLSHWVKLSHEGEPSRLLQAGLLDPKNALNVGRPFLSKNNALKGAVSSL